jgi:hypothetical protein
MNIDVMNLENTIKNENQASQQDHAKTIIFFFAIICMMNLKKNKKNKKMSTL